MEKRDLAIYELAHYAQRTNLIRPEEYIWAVNTILDVLKLDALPALTDPLPENRPLADILDDLLDDAFSRGLVAENSVVYRDLLDTELMGRLTPRPAQVIQCFRSRQRRDPMRATNWYYRFSKDTNYIRVDRIAKDVR